MFCQIYRNLKLQGKLFYKSFMSEQKIKMCLSKYQTDKNCLLMYIRPPKIPKTGTKITLYTIIYQFHLPLYMHHINPLIS